MSRPHAPRSEEDTRPSQEHEAYEDRFLAMVQNSSDVFWLLSPEGEMHTVSLSWQTFTGQMEPESLERGWLDAFPPAERLRVLATVCQAVTTNHPTEMDCTMRKDDGAFKHMRLRVLPVCTNAGTVREVILCGTTLTAQKLCQPTHLMGTTVNITDLKQAEERLQKTHQHATALLEHMIDGFFQLDEHWCFTYLNQQAEHYLATKREEIIGKSIWEVFPRFQGSFFEQRARQARVMQRVTHFETRRLWFGRRFAIRICPTPEGLSIYMQDITQRKRAEKGLRESEERFRRLVESNLIGITVLDLRGTFQEANDAFLRIVRYTREDLAAGRVQRQAITPPEYEAQDQCIIERLLTTGQPQTFEKEYMTKGGGRVPVLIGAMPFRKTDFALSALCFVVDLTAQKAAEEQRQEANQRIRAIFEGITDAFAHMDAQWYYTYVNRHAAAFWGVSQDALTGHSFWELNPGWHSTPTEHILRQAMEEQHEVHFEAWHPQRQRWLDIHVSPAQDGLALYFQDITERKHIEEALRESEMRFQGLVESNIIGIIVSDPQGTIYEANNAFLQMLGYTCEDLAAGKLQWTDLTTPEDRELSVQAVEELLTTGHFQPFEKEYLAKDGRRVPVLIGGTFFHREDPSPLLLAFVLDLTARKEIERQKDLFLGMTSHELKTPLAALRGTLQLVQRRLKRIEAAIADASPEVQTFLKGLAKNLEDSQRQIDVQTRLINDLLDVSRITANTLHLSLHRWDLGSIVRQTVEDVRVTAPERSLLLDLPEHTAVTVLADRERISQVVMNYLTNALRYSSPDQPIFIGLMLQGEQARVWVRDRGPGLSEEAQREIWQRFHQVKGVPVLSGSGKGLGLGLYICQTLIEQHQGAVGVESTPGEGSTFWLTLPTIT